MRFPTSSYKYDSFCSAAVPFRPDVTELNDDLVWRDVIGVAVLAGVGFTVALLVADLSFDGAQAQAAKSAVLLGSLVSGLLATVVLGRRSRSHRRT